MKNNIVGKYYKRKTSDGEYAVYKIIGFNGRYYISVHYYFSIGYAVKDNHHLLQKTFYNSSYFSEINELEFSIAKNLYKNSGRFECNNDKNFRRV